MESLADATDELKRVDHLIYVSLKYTRTVDVFVNIVKRMVEAYDKMFETLLKHALENKKIEEIPGSPIEKGNLIKKMYEEEQFQKNVELCFLLRKIMRVKSHTKEQEYRRHVTMNMIIDGREEKLDIDILTGYYHFQKEFYQTIKKIIIPEE